MMRASVCLSLLLITTSSVRAQTPDAARAEARERFDRGVRLFEEGDNAGALAEFKRAHDLVPNRLVLLNLGLVYAAMNRPVDAADTLDRVLGDPGPLAPERLAHARQVRDEQARRIARVAVVTNVPAIIEVNGVEAGRTPLGQPIRVAGGTHVVGAVAVGHLPSRREVTVAGGAATEVRFDLIATESRLAHIDVRSAVPGADVVVDGTVSGRTPLAASLAVPPGARVLELRRAGYRTARRELTLAEGSRGDVQMDLEEDPAAPPESRGRLALALSENEAHVTIDGRPRGVYRESMVVPAGPHRLRIERPGFEVVERDVVVPGGAETTVRVSLRPTPETRLAYVNRARSRRMWSWAAVGAGAVAALGAGALAIWAHTDLPDQEKKFAAIEQDQIPKGGGSCDPARGLPDAQRDACIAQFNQAQDRVSQRKTLRTAGAVGAGVGLALVGVGLYLRASGPDPGKYDAPVSDEPLASAWVTRHAAGAMLRLSF